MTARCARFVAMLAVVTAAAGCAGRARPEVSGPPAPPARTTDAVVLGARLAIVEEVLDDGVARELRAALPVAVARAQRWGPLGSARIVLHASDESFRSAVGETGRTALRAWTVSDVVHLRSPRTWGPGGPAEGELSDLLAHELVHCATWHRIGDRDAWVRRPLPFWFREGMAMELDDELGRSVRARLRALESRRAPVPGEGALARAEALLPDHADLAYATAWVAFRELVSHHGEAVVGRILDRVHRGATFPDAFTAETDSSLAGFDAAVRRAILAPR